MTEQAKHRSVDEIRQEYSNLCSKAGHLQYSIKCLKDDLELVNEQLKELNLEAAAAANAEASKSALDKAIEETKAVEESNNAQA